MRRPSRQMARTGGNCGLLLALVSPVGCESRNAGDAVPVAQRQQPFRLLLLLSSLASTHLLHPSRHCFRRCVITRVTVMRECESRLSNTCGVIPLYSVSAFLATQSSPPFAPPCDILRLLIESIAMELGKISRVTFTKI